MRILAACEESQAVTIELRKLGRNTYSAADSLIRRDTQRDWRRRRFLCSFWRLIVPG